MKIRRWVKDNFSSLWGIFETVHLRAWAVGRGGSSALTPVQDLLGSGLDVWHEIDGPSVGPTSKPSPQTGLSCSPSRKSFCFLQIGPWWNGVPSSELPATRKGDGTESHWFWISAKTTRKFTKLWVNAHSHGISVLCPVVNDQKKELSHSRENYMYPAEDLYPHEVDVLLGWPATVNIVLSFHNLNLFNFCPLTLDSFVKQMSPIVFFFLFTLGQQ